jgi:hypothetical protein
MECSSALLTKPNTLPVRFPSDPPVNVRAVGNEREMEVPVTHDLGSVALFHPPESPWLVVIVDHTTTIHERESSWDEAMEIAWDLGYRGYVSYGEPFSESEDFSIYMIALS